MYSKYFGLLLEYFKIILLSRFVWVTLNVVNTCFLELPYYCLQRKSNASTQNTNVVCFVLQLIMFKEKWHPQENKVFSFPLPSL